MYPQKDSEIRKLIKRNSENHGRSRLTGEVDVHSLVLPEDNQHKVSGSADEARSYIVGSNYSFFTVPLEYQGRLSDPVAALVPDPVSGIIEIPPVEDGDEPGVNWRFWQLHTLTPIRRAEVICDWKPMDNSSSPARTQVKITTA